MFCCRSWAVLYALIDVRVAGSVAVQSVHAPVMLAVRDAPRRARRRACVSLTAPSAQ
jgi:hypothetical protein